MKGDKKEVLAGIVTYNPDVKVLIQNILCLYKQNTKILVVDNGSSNYREIMAASINYQVELILNGRNFGIAAALNTIGEYAFNNNYKWFLTLDQDTIVSENLVNTLLDLSTEHERTGIVAPYINRKGDYVSSYATKKVPVVITSGSLTNTNVWKKIGGFWEFLFIDEVDHDYCYRLNKNGYSIFQTDRVKVDHRIGNQSTKKILFHTFHPTNHSAFRRYFETRNSIIMAHLYPDEKEPFHHRYFMIIRIFISVLCCESDKKNKIRSMLKGINDANKWLINNKDKNSDNYFKYKYDKYYCSYL